MMLFSKGSHTTSLSQTDIKNGLYEALDKLGTKKRVLALPPDITRIHSQSGFLTELLWEYYRNTLTDILPAIGTHNPMTEDELNMMFGKVPKSLFRVHDWRNGFVTLGEVPSSFVSEVSEGLVDYCIPIQVNRLLCEGNYDLIFSIGQVVPHEVVGLANFNKNVFIGTGGFEAINKTHFLGAVYGIERIMGRVNTPVRKVLNYGSINFAGNLPIIYILTVVGMNYSGKPVVYGLFIGDDVECFNLAAELSLKVNIEILDEPLKKVVVYLDPVEYKSTWLGNKGIYRTRMALADGGELIILAPGVSRFGEDADVDKIIRKYGYVGSKKILELVKKNEDLQRNLSTAAHLIHGSSEERFTITYCPGYISKEEIESVNFRYADLRLMMKQYNPESLKYGINIMPNGEKIFYIPNPALGLWAHKLILS